MGQQLTDLRIAERAIQGVAEQLSNRVAFRRAMRKAIQSELKILQRELGVTFVFVTHAQSEALALSLILYGITVLSSLPGGLLFALQAERKPMMVTQEQMPMDVITKDVS